jgi:hypothetical protein
VRPAGRTKKMADPKASQNNTYSSAKPITDAEHGAQFLDLRKSDSERLRVQVKEYRGRVYIDLRTWYVAEDGEYRPSSKGVTIKPTQVPEVVQALMLAGQSFDPKEAT